MKAYNTDWIYNRAVIVQAERWHRQGLLTDEQLEKTRACYPVGFRDSNAFLEIGAFIFTNIAVAGGYALLWLFVGHLFSDDGSGAVYNMLIGVAVGLIGQLLIQRQQLYRNGVDNALVVSAVALLVLGINVALPDEAALYARCLLSLPAMAVAIWFYGDTIVTCLALITVYTAVFDGVLEFSWGRTALPFIMMALSALIYVFCHFAFIVPTSGPGRRAGVFSRTSGRMAAQPPTSTMIRNLIYYDDVVTLTQWFALIALAASGNYYVVREVNALLLDPHPVVSPQLSMAWFFWFTTVAIPGVYGYIAWQYRNRVFLILALAGAAAIIATMRYYIGALPLSIHLTLTGIILALTAAFLIRFLQQSERTGNQLRLTDMPDEESPREFLLNAETLVTIQSVGSITPPDGVKFGGGSFGGGGAGEKY